MAEPCENCDDRRCMSCVLREIHDHCEDDCPSCCAAEHVVCRIEPCRWRDTAGECGGAYENPHPCRGCRGDGTRLVELTEVPDPPKRFRWQRGFAGLPGRREPKEDRNE